MTGTIPENFGGETFAFIVILPFALVVTFLIWAFIAGAIYLLIYSGVRVAVFDVTKRARIMEKVKLYVLRFYAFPRFNLPITLNTFIGIYFMSLGVVLFITIADFLFGVVV